MRILGIVSCGAALAASALAQNDWPVYGGDPGNRRYSRLAEIDTGNASKLAEAWVFDTRPTPAAHANRPAQATPLVVNGVMYVVTAHQSLVALDPESGKPIWIFTHQHVGRPPRGVAYWPGDRDNPARILFGTYDGFLLAVNAKTGKASRDSAMKAKSI